MAKHYIRINADSIVIKGFTTDFEQPISGDLLLSGQDDRHFQLPLTNDREQFIYKLVNGSMVLRTQAELDAEFNTRPPSSPSTEERLAAAEAALLSIMGL